MIILATLNARYIHSAFGLRYLYANMGALQMDTRLMEFTLEQRPLDIAEQLLADQPDIIGLGVYIWNAQQSLEVAQLLRKLSPQITLILGGPEVSHEIEQQSLTQLADYVISGNAEHMLPVLCQRILSGQAPGNKIHIAAPIPLNDIQLPYDYYTDADISHRIIYVEASRGCPFKCTFCLSALDKTAKPFPSDAFLDAMNQLYQRGVRQFKFVDRTFNLSTQKCANILRFFLDRITDQSKQGDNDLFLHFELIPDRLPDALKHLIQQFPPGSLQFEIGIQTFNPDVQTLIERKQDNAATQNNLRWLREHSYAHLHTDLIFGLPGEHLESMAASFDQLVALNPHEIQVGILKRLKGMPMTSLEGTYSLNFSPLPPYDILSTSLIDFPTMQRVRRFARYWDLVGNAGRFTHSLPLILGDAPFERFMMLSDWLYEKTGHTHKISLKRLFELLTEGMQAALSLNTKTSHQALLNDFQRSGIKGRPTFTQTQHSVTSTTRPKTPKAKNNRRQVAHLR